MKAVKAILSLTLFALAASTSASALAWHRGGHAHFGLYIGGPGYWYSPYYYPPYPPYGYPPVVVAPAAPPVYIEQDGAASAPSQPPSQAQSPAQANWWYYCAEAKAYYPYVKECAAGWQRVAPQPQQ